MKAVDALMAGLVDYAGLFPPASEDMRTAVLSYASYLKSAERRALGRFIVPLAKLSEFEDAARGLLPRGAEAEPWQLSVLIGDDLAGAGDRMLTFNREHGDVSGEGKATIETVELKANTPNDIAWKMTQLPQSTRVYFEIPLTPDTTPLVDAIAAAGARAKMRTGGVTTDAFPSSGQILDFMLACVRARVPFKATAGLHHPVRGAYNLTYDRGSARGTMYGFLNIFVAAAFLFRGDDISKAREVLEEADASAFRFQDKSIEWREASVTADELKTVRGELAISFGSCSFREPVDELHELMSEVHA